MNNVVKAKEQRARLLTLVWNYAISFARANMMWSSWVSRVSASTVFFHWLVRSNILHVHFLETRNLWSHSPALWASKTLSPRNSDTQPRGLGLGCGRIHSSDGRPCCWQIWRISSYFSNRHIHQDCVIVSPNSRTLKSIHAGLNLDFRTKTAESPTFWRLNLLFHRFWKWSLIQWSRRFLG